MGSPIPSGLAFSMLTPLHLRAFNPSPETGTLFGPHSLADTSDPASASRLITDGPAAEDLELFSLLMGTEAEQLVHASQKRSARPPYRIPSGAQTPTKKETPWFIEAENRGARRGEVRQLAFSSPWPRRLVFMDFASPGLSLYGFRIESEEADLSQTISIRSTGYAVATEQFTFRVRAKTFSNAVQLALMLSAKIYLCGQYDAPTELGEFGFRLMAEKAWGFVNRERDRFRLPSPLPIEGTPVTFASERMLDPDAAGHRQPVLTVDLLPADTERWNVGAVLRRPSNRSESLMPLHPKLIKTLWNPSFSRIFSNRTG